MIVQEKVLLFKIKTLNIINNKMKILMKHNKLTTHCFVFIMYGTHENRVDNFTHIIIQLCKKIISN
ncbi:hypothetical protein GpSGHVEth061 [Glossina pallidipes salivary gland hypertrophy virus]|uniref:Uncharacterized protein n=1 Tax=Glossina hytrovirus (isolate Glossina pallidipes/Ethiopia/Seibersdorf/-) TaxID=379529 RepID=A0A0Y0M3E6_GHVS|nr:hypothetical protein GpSGHVEth061 [Glossina pallidipes salivary gland hypertrophy virus]